MTRIAALSSNKAVLQLVKRVSRDTRTYSFSRRNHPVISIQPGETVVVETHDARTGTIQTCSDLLDGSPREGLNPVTGPIYVEDARPGDSLAVRVEEIQLAPKGFSAVKAHVGLLADQAKFFTTRIIPVEDGWVHFSDTIRFPARPMIGAIGVAPEFDDVPSLYPGVHGGNMDNNFVRPGCVLHLPVWTPGALLSLGDVHASMGDGEISMLGLDIAAEVTLRVDVIKGERIERPWIEYGGSWITTGDDLDAGRALRIACREMVSLLMNRLCIPFQDAYMLASVRADLGICQSCDPGRFPVTTRMVYDTEHA
jgi:amidase